MTKSFIYLLSLLIVFFSGCGGGGGGSSSVQPLNCNYPAGIIRAATNVPLLVVRVEYNNIAFTNDETVWSSRIFGTAAHQLNDYFQETSYGQFQFTQATENQGTPNDGVVTVSLNKSHPDPDDTYFSITQYETGVYTDLSAAVIAASNDMDFSLYDSDANGYLSLDELQIIFIIAGGEDAYGTTSLPSVWAHTNCLTTPVLTDGVSLMGCSTDGTFSLFGERHDDYMAPLNVHDATIGIIAHELGHAAFMLPDLYDTGNPSAETVTYGIGLFGMMGYGNWGATQTDESSDFYGNTPTHFSAWSKIFNGWITPQTISETTSQTFSLAQSASAQYNVLKLPVNQCEYFLLENRNNSGYDTGFFILYNPYDVYPSYFNGGLAIWHVDESVIAQNYLDNRVNNNEAHRGVDLEDAAYNRLDIGGIGHEANLYYLGNTADNAFTPYTVPSSASYSGTSSGIFVENISDRGAVMQATVTH